MKGIVISLAIIGIGGLYLAAKEPRRQAEAILNDLFPAGFTASQAQLGVLESAGYPLGSTVYQEAIDIAHKKVASACQTKNQILGYSSALGWHCTTEYYL